MFGRGLLISKKSKNVFPYTVVGNPSTGLKNPGLRGIQLYTLVSPLYHTCGRTQFSSKTVSDTSQLQEGTGSGKKPSRPSKPSPESSDSDIVTGSSSDDEEAERQDQIKTVSESFRHPIRLKRKEIRALQSQSGKGNQTVAKSAKLSDSSVENSREESSSPVNIAITSTSPKLKPAKRKPHNFTLI